MFRLAQSTILVGGEIGAVIGRAEEWAREMGGQHVVIEHEKAGDKVREIRELYRYARGVRREPIVFIINADSFFATVTNEPWQNAFLKLFEEPGANIYFAVATTAPQKLLTTIRSRGQVVNLGVGAAEAARTDWFEISVYERLRVVAKIKTREEGVALVQMIAAAAMGDARQAGSLAMINDTLERLVQNGNVKIQLTNLAVNL
jgi:DNA polymerase III delta prime subunit